MHPDHNEFIKHYLRWLAREDLLGDSPLNSKGDCARAFNKEIELTKEAVGYRWEPMNALADLDKLTINLEQAQNVPWRVFASRMKYLLENY